MVAVFIMPSTSQHYRSWTERRYQQSLASTLNAAATSPFLIERQLQDYANVFNDNQELREENTEMCGLKKKLEAAEAKLEAVEKTSVLNRSLARSSASSTDVAGGEDRRGGGGDAEMQGRRAEGAAGRVRMPDHPCWCLKVLMSLCASNVSSNYARVLQPQEFH